MKSAAETHTCDFYEMIKFHGIRGNGWTSTVYSWNHSAHGDRESL